MLILIFYAHELRRSLRLPRLRLQGSNEVMMQQLHAIENEAEKRGIGFAFDIAAGDRTP